MPLEIDQIACIAIAGQARALIPTHRVRERPLFQNRMVGADYHAGPQGAPQVSNRR
jgi:hypothetical protein